MGVGDMPKISLAAFVLLLIGTLLAVIGVATPNWVSSEVFGVKIHSGLFRGCSGDICADIKGDADWFKATQAMMIIGVILYIIACVFTPFFFCGVNSGPIKSNVVSMIVLIGTWCAAISMLIGLSIYTAELEDANYDWSYGLCWAAVLIAIITGVLLLRMKQQNVSPSG